MYSRRLRSYSKKRQRAEQVLSQWGVRRWRRRYSNDVDPITLDIPQEPVFRQVSEYGVVTGFDGQVLSNYLLATGNLAHPVTRTPFNSCELLRLDNLCQTSISSQQKALEQKLRDDSSTQNQLFFLESNVADAVTHMLELAEHPMRYRREDVMIFYMTRGQPRAQERFERLMSVNAEAGIRTLNNLLMTVTNAANNGTAQRLLCISIRRFLSHLKDMAEQRLL